MDACCRYGTVTKQINGWFFSISLFDVWCCICRWLFIKLRFKPAVCAKCQPVSVDHFGAFTLLYSVAVLVVTLVVAVVKVYSEPLYLLRQVKPSNLLQILNRLVNQPLPIQRSEIAFRWIPSCHFSNDPYILLLWDEMFCYCNRQNSTSYAVFGKYTKRWFEKVANL